MILENISKDDQAFNDMIKSNLSQGPCKVTFTKTDGTEREMICTTSLSLAEHYERKTDREKKTSDPDVQAVFDLEKQAWRSFKYSKLISFQSEVKWP